MRSAVEYACAFAVDLIFVRKVAKIDLCGVEVILGVAHLCVAFVCECAYDSRLQYFCSLLLYVCVFVGLRCEHVMCVCVCLRGSVYVRIHCVNE